MYSMIPANVMTALRYTSADTIAETVNLPAECYAYLWNEIVPRQKQFQGDNHEECGIWNYWLAIPEQFKQDIIQAIDEVTE